MLTLDELKKEANEFISKVNNIEMEQSANLKTKEHLEKTIQELVERNSKNNEALDIATHAIEIIREVSDEAVKQAYEFIEESLNAALERMFANTTRKIKLKEYTRGNQYPQLIIELNVGNGKVRSLKSDSGHGLAQIVSLLSILSLIVITNSRRILVMDEIISGLSVHNRKIVTDILWSFTEIGFQFIINEHGYIPQGSKVYHLEMVGDVSHVKESYIADTGVYLQGTEDEEYQYSNSEVNKERDTIKSTSDTNKELQSGSVISI